MSTRSCIGRTDSLHPSEDIPVVYVHWDGYPSGVGAELFSLIRDHFGGDVGAALTFLIDDHPAGWSVLHGDWSQAPGFIEHEQQACVICGLKTWEHYSQYYFHHDPPLPLPDDAIVRGGTALIRDHSPEGPPYEQRRPQCYCHGDRHEEPWDLTLSKAPGSGCEYAYVISPETRTMYVLSSYCEDGEKMIGFFGMGDAGATWKLIGEVDLDGPEPNWERMGAA